jgi:transcriptional regulator with XRE-family HTH domain
MSYTTQIPEKLRKIRELKGYSQEYMALQMDMSQRQYQRIESGEADISMGKLEEMCKALEVSVEQLMGFDEQFIFNNCTNVGGGKEVTVNVHFPKEMAEMIQHLEKEIVYLREVLKGKL